MRKLMYFGIGFGVACALSVYLLQESLLPWLSAALVVAAVILLLLRKKLVVIIGIVCIGLSFGQLWYWLYDMQYLMPARAMDGQTVSITAEATDFSFDSEYGITVDAKTTLGDRLYNIRMYLDQTEPVSPGMVIEGMFQLRYTASGGSREATYHSGDGTLFLAYQRGEHLITDPGSSDIRHLPAYLRANILQLLSKLFPEDTLPFAKALLMGDTTDLDYKTDTELSLSGIRHVAAVSGLHVSILFSMIYLFSGRRRGMTVLMGIPLLLLFAAMAGFSASIVRASVMQFLMLFALLLKKEYDPPTALSFAALVMLMINPLVITSVGFQLSVGSVAGIFLFSGRIRGWLLDPHRFGKYRGILGKLCSKFSASVSVSMSAMIFTAPLSAMYFGTVSLVSPLTNLLCLWVVTALFCGIIIACIIGAILLPFGQAIAWVLSWAVRYILGIAHFVSQLPMSAVFTESVYIAIWLLFCYILLSVFLLSKEKRPVVLGCCAVIGLCTALLASWLEPLTDEYRVTILDVGQGQCILLQSEGKTYMVDCGGSYDEGTADLAAATLLSQGVRELDGLILTHYDKDHMGAAEFLLQRVPAKVLILPQGEGGENWETQILPELSGEKITAVRDIQISWGNAAITIFSSQYHENNNESSLCVLFQRENCDILITGDRSIVGEMLLLRSANIPMLDALIVGHHGAANATSELLLQATRPDVAVISVGAGNAYGHPSQRVLDLLTQYGCVIRRTDLEGTIILRG